jgi:hypothetical protein
MMIQNMTSKQLSGAEDNGLKTLRLFKKFLSLNDYTVHYGPRRSILRSVQ